MVIGGLGPWWFGILGEALSNTPFHFWGFQIIQTTNTNPNHQFTRVHYITTQTKHYYKGIPQNSHTFAACLIPPLGWSQEVGNWFVNGL